MQELRLIIQRDEEDIEAAEVYVDGQISGHPYRFLLDTGAGTTTVLYDAFTASFESAGQTHSSGVFSPKQDDLINVPTLTIGAIHRQGVVVARMAQAAQNVRNLIGMDILKEYALHFRFDERRVLVDPEIDAQSWQTLFMDKKHHPYMTVQFGGVSAQVVWDTGASITIVDQAFIREHRAFFTPMGASVGTDGTGAQQETPMYEMAAYTIGGWTFAPHKVAGVDLSFVNSTIEHPMTMILGYTTLSQARWLMDFPRARWTITAMPGKE